MVTAITQSQFSQTPAGLSPCAVAISNRRGEAGSGEVVGRKKKHPCVDCGQPCQIIALRCRPCECRSRVEELSARFWHKVRIGGPDECWPWTGHQNPKGYGVIGYRGKLFVAHRVAWMLTFGDVPVGMSICHHCDNPPCCNPSHLWAGTHAENMRDMMVKGRNHSPGLSPNTPFRETRFRWPLVRTMRAIYATGKVSTALLGRVVGIGQSAAYNIVHNRTWRET